MAISIEDFAHLLQEPIPQHSMAGKKQCPLRCKSIDDLELCTNDCHNAPFRRLLIEGIMKKRF